VLAPYEIGCQPQSRFRSQVLSTSQRFPSRPKFRGLVSCHNRSWDSSFRVFPSQKSRAPLEARLLPCGHSPTCCDAAFRSLSPLVSSTSTLSCGRLISPTTMSSLFTLPKERFPVTPGPNDETRLVPPASPTSKP
jgi:hypothetical protein